MFELWMIYVIIASAAVITEICAPSFFCINFAFAGIIAALISLFINDFYVTMSAFLVLSLFSIIFIKPLLIKYFKKPSSGDFDDLYKGKIVKTIEPVTSVSGAVSIYDERWEARIKEGQENIDAGCDVRITGNDSLILFVEKV